MRRRCNIPGYLDFSKAFEKVPWSITDRTKTFGSNKDLLLVPALATTLIAETPFFVLFENNELEEERKRRRREREEVVEEKRRRRV